MALGMDSLGSYYKNVFARSNEMGNNLLKTAPGQKFLGWNSAATDFFHSTKPVPKNFSVLGHGPKFAAKESARNIGTRLNSFTYKVANKSGDKLIKAMSNTSGKLGPALMKVPGLDKVANGLSKLGKAGGNKIPGLGTVFALVTGVLGIGKSVSLAAKGDGAGAGHKLLKTAGSIGGILGGIALMATGVGIVPGLALALGAGIAGDWAGKKAGDLVFGQVDPQTGHSASYLQKQAGAQQANQNPFFAQNSMALSSNDQFDAYVQSIMNNPGLR